MSPALAAAVPPSTSSFPRASQVPDTCGAARVAPPLARFACSHVKCGDGPRARCTVRGTKLMMPEPNDRWRHCLSKLAPRRPYKVCTCDYISMCIYSQVCVYEPWTRCFSSCLVPVLMCCLKKSSEMEARTG
jgi:hypothetical protein